MFLLLLVLSAAVYTGRSQKPLGYWDCMTNHGATQNSNYGALDEQRRSRLEFSIALFKQIARQQPSENVFISPLSIYNTLLLMFFTSAGYTETSLRNLLTLSPNEEKTDMLKAYNFFKMNLAYGRYKSQVHSATRMFISDNQVVKDCMAEIFFDEIEMVDFSPKGLAKTVKSINDWVANHTNNKIQNLVSADISPDSQIVLANVAYFKGVWKNQFDPLDTKMENFYISKNKTAKVPMMFQLNTFNHWRSERMGAEVLELPYLEPTEETSDISLILLLPNESDSQHPASDLVMRLDSASILAIVKESSDPKNEDNVEVKLPKFSLETTLELNPVLETMGVGDLFRPSANFTDLTGGPSIKLSRGIHKAKVKLNEFGTEAAAATVFTTFMLPGESFICDRPFVYLLYDKKVDSLLFAGVYNYPSQ